MIVVKSGAAVQRIGAQLVTLRAEAGPLLDKMNGRCLIIPSNHIRGRGGAAGHIYISSSSGNTS